MTRIYWIVAIDVLVLALDRGAPAWLYPGLPDRIPTHWNIKGEVDGYVKGASGRCSRSP